jgi:DNA-binding PadR family transcriptional regulator
MERKLLLLGLLRSQEMHGYQINELIDAHLGTSIELKKPTVYKLLGAMVNDGWINFHEEREGNYPTRRVYRITTEGEEVFQQLLRQSLADYKPISYLGNVGIMYLDTLPVEEAAALLQQRTGNTDR